jgi:putative ABC transport system substrate-binding protein
MRRREFIAGLGSAAAWPVVARAQQPERMRRIGVLMAWDENEPVAKFLVSKFIQALADLGWTDGRNVRMDFRWHGDDTNRIRALARELVGLQPEIIVTIASAPATVALQRETQTIPIVFAIVADPVAQQLRSLPPLDACASEHLSQLTKGAATSLTVIGDYCLRSAVLGGARIRPAHAAVRPESG